MKKKIIDNTIFVLGVIAAIFFLLFNSKIGVLIVGLDIIFLIISILLIINKNNLGIALAIISGTVGITLYLHHIKYFTVAESISFILIFSLLLLTVFSTIKYIKDLKDNERTHEMLVVAEIIDLIKNPNIIKEYYIPVLGYEINGEKFEVNFNAGFSKNVPEIGTTYNIYVNPNDHFDVYFKPPAINIAKNIGVNVFLAIVSIIILFQIIH